MSKLKFSKDKKGDVRWQVSTRVAGKTKIVDAATEGFKRLAGAIKNLKSSARRLNEVTSPDILIKAIEDFKKV